MILAAGRGERMRPLTDTTPKPLLVAGGKPLIVWQIEALARAGFREIVINAAHLADAARRTRSATASRYGVRIHWSREAEPLEPAGGIATAMPLCPKGPLVSCPATSTPTSTMRRCAARADTMALDDAAPRVASRDGAKPGLSSRRRFRARRRPHPLGWTARLTFGNIARLRHRAVPRTSARR